MAPLKLGENTQNEATRPATDASRRRLLRGGLAAAPVLLTLASKPVSATTCTSASSFSSLKLSGPGKTTVCGGKMPSAWQDPCNFKDWPSAYIPDDKNACQGSYQAPKNAVVTKFDEVFGSSGGYPSTSLVQMLALSNETGKDGLARYLVAALLNAEKGLTPASVLSVSMVKGLWADYVARGYCEPVGGIKWYPDYASPASPKGGLIAWLKTTMSA